MGVNAAAGAEVAGEPAVAAALAVPEAARGPMRYVAASAASAGHHAWSATPWTRRLRFTLRGGAPYHPNADGMAAVARLVLAALAGSPGEPA